MCEITNGKIYVADRDLVCYKVMFKKGNILESVHQGYEYKIGWTYCVKAFEYRCLTGDIIYEEWEQSLSSYAGWRKDYTTYPTMHLDCINTGLRYTQCGFYSYTYYGNSSMELENKILNATMMLPIYGPDKIKIVRCRIPEGSKYMVSDNGEVFISERIVIDDAWLSDV